MPAPQAVIAGTTHQLGATTRDAGGNALTGRAVTWATGSEVVATVSTSGMLTAVAPGQTTVTATSEGKVGTATLVVLPVPVASVVVTPATFTLVESGQQQFAAEARSASGAALPGRGIAWSTGDPAIATVSGGGMVTAVAPGVTQVIATSEGRQGSATLTVTARPVTSVVVEPASATVDVGATQSLAAVTRVSGGTVVTGRTVTWGTSDAAIATVSAAGVVTGVAVGSATITATSEGQQGTAAVTVRAAVPAPAISGVEPSSLVPGGTVTVTGTNFAAGATIDVGTVSLPATLVSPTQLTAIVPCIVGGDVGVRVTVDGRSSAAVQRPLQVTRRTLAPGQSIVLSTNADSRCNELPGSTGDVRYLVTVFSVGSTANTQASFQVAGTTAAPVAGAPFVAAPRTVRADAAPAATPLEAAARAHDRVHLRHMERDRAEVTRLRGRLAAGGRLRALREQQAHEPPPAVGAMRSIYFIFGANCGDTTRVIRARAVYVGPTAVVWEDSANALQSANDAALAGAYQRLAQVYERDQHATIARYFGDPLRRDDALDNDDRVHMVFTQRLNNTGAAAYVTGCDQFPRYDGATPVAPGSNFGEFFYSVVPTTAGSNPNSTAFPDGWYAFLSRTVVHEVKHIASVSARVANGAPGEVGWLEEGSARMAEEMWVRDSLHRTPWRSNTGFGTAATNGVYCDFHLTDGACNANDPFRRPTWGLRRQFNEIRPKLVAPWNWSPYGDGTGQAGAVFYNTTWSLLRYAMDRYGTSEEAFLTALTQSSQTGLANILGVSGTTAEQLIGGWGMALYADDYPGTPTTNPDIQFRTWNLRSIYAGLNASLQWAQTWTTAWPVEAPVIPFGAFNSGQTVRGGAHSFYVIQGTFATPLAIQLRASGGGAPDAALRVAIARLQ